MSPLSMFAFCLHVRCDGRMGASHIEFQSAILPAVAVAYAAAVTYEDAAVMYGNARAMTFLRCAQCAAAALPRLFAAAAPPPRCRGEYSASTDATNDPARYAQIHHAAAGFRSAHEKRVSCRLRQSLPSPSGKVAAELPHGRLAGIRRRPASQEPR